jgi:DNA-binding response OmpR family regulator
VTSLTKWGFAVHPVFTGHDAVKELQNCGFDVVLLDYQLPDLDGSRWRVRFVIFSQTP